MQKNNGFSWILPHPTQSAPFWEGSALLAFCIVHHWVHIAITSTGRQPSHTNGERYHIRIAHGDASLSAYPNATAPIITHHGDHTQPPFPSSCLVLSVSTQHQFYCVTFPGETSVHMYSSHVGQQWQANETIPLTSNLLEHWVHQTGAWERHYLLKNE